MDPSFAADFSNTPVLTTTIALAVVVFMHARRLMAIGAMRPIYPVAVVLSMLLVIYTVSCLGKGGCMSLAWIWAVMAILGAVAAVMDRQDDV